MTPHLKSLEGEAIYVLREVAAQFQNPVMLFSGGKDSVVMSHLAELAFRPGRFPFPLMIIDTGHNFPETLQFIEERMAELGEKLLVKFVQQTIDAGKAKDELGFYKSRNRIQSITLMDAIQEHQFDAVIGGGRRDEEKARAKERIFSHRNAQGNWTPENQRPELWNLLNGKIRLGEHMRVFPLSNWTEMDVWEYIKFRNIRVPSLYFSHHRNCVRVGSSLFAFSKHMDFAPEDPVQPLKIRFRTVGDMTCTAAMVSDAQTVEEIIAEIKNSRIGERGLRADDRFSETSMEDRKREGYF